MAWPNSFSYKVTSGVCLYALSSSSRLIVPGTEIVTQPVRHIPLINQHHRVAPIGIGFDFFGDLFRNDLLLSGKLVPKLRGLGIVFRRFGVRLRVCRHRIIDKGLNACQLASRICDVAPCARHLRLSIFMCQPVCVCPNLLYSRLDFHYTDTQREARRATHIPTST